MRCKSVFQAAFLVALQLPLVACSQITRLQADVMYAKGGTYPTPENIPDYETTTRRFSGVSACAITEEERLKNEAIEKRNAELAAAPPVSFTPQTVQYTTDSWAQCGINDWCMTRTTSSFTTTPEQEAPREPFTGDTIEKYRVVQGGKALHGTTGWVITNHWQDGNDDHYFIKVVKNGFEYIIPKDVTKQSWRLVYRDADTRRDSDGTLRPEGHPSARCKLDVDTAPIVAPVVAHKGTGGPAPAGVTEACTIPPRPEPGVVTPVVPTPLRADWGHIDGAKFLYTSSAVLGATGTIETNAQYVMFERECLAAPKWTTTADGRPALELQLFAKSKARGKELITQSASGQFMRASCGTYGAVETTSDLEQWEALKDPACAEAFAADPAL